MLQYRDSSLVIRGVETDTERAKPGRLGVGSLRVRNCDLACDDAGYDFKTSIAYSQMSVYEPVLFPRNILINVGSKQFYVRTRISHYSTYRMDYNNIYGGSANNCRICRKTHVCTALSLAPQKRLQVA